MPLEEALDVELTAVFKEDCKKQKFPDHEIEAVVSILVEDPLAGEPVTVVTPDGKRFGCNELRVLPWIYDRDGAAVCAALLYLQAPGRLRFLRLEVERADELMHIDPAKMARWVEAVLEFIEAAKHLV